MERDEKEQVTINSLKSKMKRIVDAKIVESMCAEDLLLLTQIIEMLNRLDKDVV